MAASIRFDRRSAMKAAGAGVLAAVAGPMRRVHAEAATQGSRHDGGHIKQSVCRWCYGKIPLEKLALAAKRIGFQSVELLTPDQYKAIEPLGLTCAMLSGACTIPDGFNRKENHARLVKSVREHVDFAADHKLPNVIFFSGNRRGMSDEEGLANCAEGIKKVVGFAEKKNVMLCMELLNSKVDHHDYMCDHTAWGVKLVKTVGSPRFKLLYDIYHMQIMEGDVIRTIRDNHEYLAHFHTGGVPGRHEIDETQELYYPAVVRAILDTGFTGYLAQEFVPAREPLDSLAQGFRICNV
ncbi:MAG TPA: sugar phosphate isomerase/epimerase family protein [Lacipirellulaceae bacterium]|nr:sugar phosphate isomerase/epimerase family protein [Lacipirellulaceae bacterium]